MIRRPPPPRRTRQRGELVAVGAATPGTEVSFEIGNSLLKGWTFKTVVEGSSVPQTFIPAW